MMFEIPGILSRNLRTVRERYCGILSFRCLPTLRSHFLGDRENDRTSEKDILKEKGDLTLVLVSFVSKRC